MAFAQKAMGAAAGVSDVWPVSAQGATRLSFSLCNAAAAPGYHFTWDFDAVRRRYVEPIAAALAPVTAVTVDSQVGGGASSMRSHIGWLCAHPKSEQSGPVGSLWPDNRFFPMILWSNLNTSKTVCKWSLRWIEKRLSVPCVSESTR